MPAKKKPATKNAPAKAAGKAEEPKKKVKAPPELLRGFRDILPEEQEKWAAVRDKAREMAEAYSFGRIELPVLERADLFLRSVGSHTDIVEKEMYTFEDPAGDKVALRPEGTASAVRAYINHGMVDRPQPVKLWYDGPMFRHERPQAGRYRQHHQIGFETLGVGDPIVDAQLIAIGANLMKDLGLDVMVHINSIGTPETRQAYLAELVAYFRPHRSKFEETDKKRLQKNPLRLLDSKDPAVQELLPEAPQIVDWLDENSKNHFMKVLEFLDEAEIGYVLDPTLVRGLDYYTHTVFEYRLADDDNEKAQNALGGGGRYDLLAETLGGRETSGCGMALGIERLARAMTEKGIEPEPHMRPQIFFAQLGDAARRAGMTIFEEFRKEGISVIEAFGKNALKAQLEVANKQNVDFTLILGQKEVLDGTIIIRDMESGAQESVDIKKIVPMMKKKLEKKS